MVQDDFGIGADVDQDLGVQLDMIAVAADQVKIRRAGPRAKTEEASIRSDLDQACLQGAQEGAELVLPKPTPYNNAGRRAGSLWRYLRSGSV
ncbi:hypothetical protein [Streptosporangium sp. NPDC050280]|uniref:hypothetical protein n=1 Tax=unclassified Streptosporangium TaxID=2632669 RepID=UPI00341CF596